MATPSVISHEEWALAIRRHLGESERFELLSVEWNMEGMEIKGFLGDHLTAKVLVSVDGNKQQQFNYFVKTTALCSDFRTDFIDNTNTYVKEITVFSTIFEQFRQHGLMCRENTWAPECFFTRPDLLLMEDLVSAGFRMFDKMECMDFAHCRLVLLALARFHAASLILEEKEKRKCGTMRPLNQMYPSAFTETMFTKDVKNSMCTAVQASFKAVQAIIDAMGSSTPRDSLYDKLQLIYEYVKPSSKYRNVLAHADLWPNNMMFRYGAESGSPEEVRIVDYQMVRYAPPALDVMCFLHLVTRRHFREAHLEELLSLYHDQMAAQFQRHGVGTLVSWDEFRDSCQHYTPAALIYAPMNHHVILIPGDVLAANLATKESYEKNILYDRNDMTVQCFKEIATYRERLMEDLEELLKAV